MHVSLTALRKRFAKPGTVAWLGIRPARRAPVVAVDSVVADPACGLDGDHFAGRRNTVRQVTLIQSEHLPAIASYIGVERIDPNLLRRNIVVEGINLLALKDMRFAVGEAVLEMTGHCHPCSRMEEALGTGGYNAVRGHGGITARVIEGGVVRIGDTLRPV